MTATVLRDIPFGGDFEKAKEALHISNNPKMEKRFDELVLGAAKIAKPKAVFAEAFVDSIEGSDVTIGGVVFSSRVMSSNLKGVGRVFIYAATCGTEVEEWSHAFKDSALDQYLADNIKQLVLFAGMEYVMKYLTDTYELGKTAAMNPGSLPDWPISEQTKLLPLIGDVKELIGLSLTESFLLVPIKSVSGMLFPTEVDYVNCKLCTKKTCSGRQAPFDAQMYKEKLGKTI